MSQGSAVSIATRHGLEDPGTESGWGRDFPHLSRRALEPTQRPVQCVPSLSPGRKKGQGVALTPPHLVRRLKKGYSYTATPPLGLHGLY